MAIKDQCLKCRHFGGEYCKQPSTNFVFDQSSCIFYEKSTINLQKVDEESARRDYEARRRAALASDVAPSAPSYNVQEPTAAPPAYETPVQVTPSTPSAAPTAPAQPARPARPARPAAPAAPAPDNGGGRSSGGRRTSTRGAQQTGGKSSGNGMFANPFSFKGRIQRTEYVLSYIIAYFGIQIFVEIGDLGGFLCIALMWFWLSQYAKRCHDVGNSAWYMLIPFYFVYLVFVEGDCFDNQYGPAPKD